MIINEFKSFNKVSVTDIPYLKKAPRQLVVSSKFVVGSDGILIQHFLDGHYLSQIIGQFNFPQRVFIAVQIINLVESLDSIYFVDLSLNNFVVSHLLNIKIMTVEINHVSEDILGDLKLLIIEILSGERHIFIIKPSKLIASIYEASNIDDLRNILINQIDFKVVKRSNNNGSTIKNLLSKSFWKRKHLSRQY